MTLYQRFFRKYLVTYSSGITPSSQFTLKEYVLAAAIRGFLALVFLGCLAYFIAAAKPPVDQLVICNYSDCLLGPESGR